MTMLCGILLGIVVVLTLLLAPWVGSVGLLISPDPSGSSLQLAMITLPRWLALAAVLGVLLARGELTWAGNSRALQVIAVMGLHVLLGIVSIALLSIAANQGLSASGKLPFTLPLFISFIQPLLVAAYAALKLFPKLGGDGLTSLPTGLLIGIAVTGLVGMGTIGAEFMRGSRENEENRKRDIAVETQKAEAETAAFMALAPDAPLATWLPYTVYGTEESKMTRALAIIGQRPNLVAEVAAELKSADANRVEAVLRAVGALKPHPPAGLAPLVFQSAQELSVFMAEANSATLELQRDLDLKAHQHSMALIEALKGLHAAGVEIKPQLTAIRDQALKRSNVDLNDIVRVYEFYLNKISSAPASSH